MNILKYNIAEKNGVWKGDKVGRVALHLWIKKRLPKPTLCPICKKFPPLDLANISQKYKRDINDFEWLCRSCHIRKENRFVNNGKYVRTKENTLNIGHYVRTEKNRLKMSLALKGKPKSKEHKIKLSLSAKKRYSSRKLNKLGQFI